MSRPSGGNGEVVRPSRGRGGYDEYFLPAPESEQTGRSWRETVAGRNQQPESAAQPARPVPWSTREPLPTGTDLPGRNDDPEYVAAQEDSKPLRPPRDVADTDQAARGPLPSLFLDSQQNSVRRSPVGAPTESIPPNPAPAPGGPVPRVRLDLFPDDSPESDPLDPHARRDPQSGPIPAGEQRDSTRQRQSNQSARETPGIPRYGTPSGAPPGTSPGVPPGTAPNTAPGVPPGTAPSNAGEPARTDAASDAGNSRPQPPLASRFLSSAPQNSSYSPPPDQAAPAGWRSARPSNISPSGAGGHDGAESNGRPRAHEPEEGKPAPPRSNPYPVAGQENSDGNRPDAPEAGREHYPRPASPSGPSSGGPHQYPSYNQQPEQMNPARHEQGPRPQFPDAFANPVPGSQGQPSPAAASESPAHHAQRPAPQAHVPGAAHTPMPPVGSVPPPPPPLPPQPDTGHVYRPLPESAAQAEVAAAQSGRALIPSRTAMPDHPGAQTLAAVHSQSVAPIPAPPPLLNSQTLAAMSSTAQLPVPAGVRDSSAAVALRLTPEELLADITARRRVHLRSNSGMRGALNKVGFQLGLSASEQRTQLRRSRIRRHLTTHCQIAVVNVKGGVGRTTVVATLGATFASLRPDRVVAVDANPDFGDLGGRTGRHPFGLTLRDLARAPRVDAFSAVQSFASITESNLAVVASPWTSAAAEPLSGQEYVTGVGVLRRHYNLSLIDCGTGVLDSATDAVLRTSDAVVVVTPATVRGVTGAIATLEWLDSHGLSRLALTSVIAIVHHYPAKPVVEIERIEELFATANRPTFRIPYDEHLAEGGEIDLRLLDKETAMAFEELAAALADGFPADHSGVDRGGRW